MVSLKLLLFRAAELQIWFPQAEPQLAVRKIIADGTKYFYVLSALDQATILNLKDFLLPNLLLVDLSQVVDT